VLELYGAWLCSGARDESGAVVTFAHSSVRERQFVVQRLAAAGLGWTDATTIECASVGGARSVTRVAGADGLVQMLAAAHGSVSARNGERAFADWVWQFVAARHCVRAARHVRRGRLVDDAVCSRTCGCATTWCAR
jgi:hypothetical protein